MGGTESKGFAGWILVLGIYVAYMVWAFVPDEKLHSWNITYFPSKYWAVALPSYLVAVLFLFVLGLVGICIITTPPLSSYDVLKGQLTTHLPLLVGAFLYLTRMKRMSDLSVSTADSTDYNVPQLAPFAVPDVEDLPLQQVSDKLHL